MPNEDISLPIAVWSLWPWCADNIWDFRRHCHVDGTLKAEGMTLICHNFLALYRKITIYNLLNTEEWEIQKLFLSQIVVIKMLNFVFRIPYLFSATNLYPGKFMLSYMPRKSVRHEFVSVTPEGFRYRGNMFHSLNQLVRWFKEHFRDPIPGEFLKKLFKYKK